MLVVVGVVVVGVAIAVTLAIRSWYGYGSRAWPASEIERVQPRMDEIVAVTLDAADAEVVRDSGFVFFGCDVDKVAYHRTFSLRLAPGDTNTEMVARAAAAWEQIGLEPQPGFSAISTVARESVLSLSVSATSEDEAYFGVGTECRRDTDRARELQA